MKFLASRPLPLLLVFLIKVVAPSEVFADNNNQFVTIVNPIRISRYTKDIKGNLDTQYEVISSNKLPATWLLTYDAIVSNDVFEVVEGFNNSQELGIFLEVSPKFAEEAGVEYYNTGFWHHATSLFLSGYLQEERKKLIDTVFEKFKQTFGYYPTSVGAWWIDAFSLDYMQRAYGITANLGVSDQFSTDGYQVWGQYWSTPFYPSKYHAAIPASSAEVKLDVVTIQWAPRDPLNGYFNSYYSTQDYLQSPVLQDTSYFEKLVNLYVNKSDNQFGHIVVGLEADLSPEAYEGEFAKQIASVKRLSDEEMVRALTMREFAAWYRSSFPNLSPSELIETDDLLGKPVKVIWYQSPRYRIGISHDYETKDTKIFDLRSYHSDFQEPYFFSPNKEFELSIYIPSYFDEINNPEDVWEVEIGSLKSVEKKIEGVDLIFESGKIVLRPASFSVEGYSDDVPTVLSRSPALSVSTSTSKLEIFPRENWVVGKEGYIFWDLTDIATHELSRRRTAAILLLCSLVFLLISSLVIFSELSERAKLIVLTLIIITPFVYFFLWYQRNSMYYYVSQAEIDALFRLSQLPQGRVVVYDKECLGCVWHTQEKPAAFANKRNYVQKWAKKPIVYNSTVFEAKGQHKARTEFVKLNVEYIYLTKYEDYIEKTPYSPGDLGIEKIYDNANAEIWRVKEEN